MIVSPSPRTVFVSGSFNVLHPGHFRLLRFARECGDRLIVAVFSDRMAASSAHVPEEYRLEMIRASGWVDDAFLLDEPLTEVLQRLKPAIVVKGKEHEARFNPELSIVESYGGRLLFSSGEALFSSLDLIRSEFTQANLQTIHLPGDFMARHGLHQTGLARRVEGFAQQRVCVVGDLIIDEYVTCQPLGMSQEDPTLVVTPIDSTRFIGGAGIVAAHAAGLGANVRLISVTGIDSSQTFAREGLEAYGVKACLLEDDSRPTTLKQRFRSKGKTLLRVSHLRQGSISTSLQARVLDEVMAVLPAIDLLVFSDFNYGCLPQALVNQIIQAANQHQVMIVADSQSSSQVGDISRFRGMNLITPTEREARLSTRNQEDGLVILAEQLQHQADARNILLKLGEEGVLIHVGNGESEWVTDRVSALNRSPKDVAGAGDSLLIASALTLASGGNIWEAACLGSLAAAIQVGRVGNTPVQVNELLSELS